MNNQELIDQSDLVILERNPLKAGAADIRDIRALLTLKDGEEVYRDSPVNSQLTPRKNLSYAGEAGKVTHKTVYKWSKSYVS